MKCFFHKQDDSALLFMAKGLPIKKCKIDQLVFTDKSFDFSYKKYHRDFEYNQSDRQFKNIFLKRINKIKKFKLDGKALDIGCSTGAYLGLLKELGWDVTGIETSKQAAKIAADKGIRVLTQSFESTNFKDQRFDLIILNHTLEHLENPLDVFQKIYKLLNPSGMVIVDLPNFDCLSEKYRRDKWKLLLPNEHPWQFTPQTLRLLFEKAGLKDIQYDTSSGLLDYANPIFELLLALVTFKKRFFNELAMLPWNLVETILNKGSDLSMVGFKK